MITNSLTAALALLTTSTVSFAGVNDLTKAQTEIIGAFADVKIAAHDCSMYKENMSEFIVWTAASGVNADVIGSEDAKLLVWGVTMARRGAQEDRKIDPTTMCDSWWEMYGIEGRYHKNLLLKR